MKGRKIKRVLSFWRRFEGNPWFEYLKEHCVERGHDFYDLLRKGDLRYVVRFSHWFKRCECITGLFEAYEFADFLMEGGNAHED